MTFLEFFVSLLRVFAMLATKRDVFLNKLISLDHLKKSCGVISCVSLPLSSFAGYRISGLFFMNAF